MEKEDVPFDNRILKQRINQWKNKSGGKKEAVYLTDHYKWFTEYYKSKPRPSTGKPLAKSILKPYNNTLRILEDYEEHIGGRLAFQHVNLTFHSEFIQWLQDKGYTDNYLGTQIKNIKTVMHDAFERGLHKNMDYKKSAFTKPKEDVNHIYLPMEELAKIKNLNLIGRPDLDRPRDLFILAAVTGLMVSDYHKLRTSNIQPHRGIKY